MRSFLILLVMLGLVSMFSVACGGGRGSTRVRADDDSKGPRSSGPYTRDLIEVTDEIAEQLKKQKVIESFMAKWDGPPTVAIIRPQNDTRFPEVSQIFQENLMAELMDRYTRDELNFSHRDSDVQAAIDAERAEKEAGERTDRTGRRTKAGADFFLKAKFTALSMTDGEYEDDTILYTFELIDAETDIVQFKGSHLIRRISRKSVAYR